MSSRAGIGYDVHRLEEGRRLVIGGVEIEGAERGLAGHSDADVLTHAVIDALLGAAGLGDIGEHFPDTDERLRGVRSLGLLEQVRGLVEDAGLAIVNIDATVVCEGPKLGPHRAAMRSALAGAAGLRPADVNVKFTTGEGVGSVGRSEAVAATAIASVRPAG